MSIFWFLCYSPKCAYPHITVVCARLCLPDAYTKINDELRKGIIFGYQPEKIRRRKQEQKLYENDQYATQSRENESRFHYLCKGVTYISIKALSFITYNVGFTHNFRGMFEVFFIRLFNRTLSVCVVFRLPFWCALPETE